MCRKYEYYFQNECQHTHRSPAWHFPCSTPTTCLSLTIHGLTSPHHCPTCLSVYWHLVFKASPFITLPQERLLAAERVFQSAEKLRRIHSSGVHQISQWDIEAFRKFQVRISPEDRNWLQEMEEDMSCLIWKQARSPEAEPPPLEQRMLVLQMRDAHQHARVLELEDEKREDHLLDKATERVLDSNIARIRGLLTPVAIQGSAACDICFDPFQSLETGVERKEIAVGLPCGHVVGQTCIEIWLQYKNRDCPFCRRSFGLLEAEETDIQTEIQLSLEPAQFEHPTPFWIEILRGL